MSPETKNFYDFGDFRLDLAEKVLMRGGNFIPVTPKVFETLCVLVERAGKIVGKEELMQRIWQDRFVEESNLTFNIGMLRKALGDDAANPRYVETVPRRGYRFIAEVRRAENTEPEKQSNAESSVGLSAASHSQSHSFFPLHKTSRPDDAATVIDQRHETNGNGTKQSASPTATLKNVDGQTSKFESVRAKLNSESKSRHRFLALAGLIFFVFSISAGYAAYRLFRYKNTADFSKLEITRLTSNGKTKSAAVSPDGRFVAYLLADEGRESLWIKNVAAGSSDVQILPPSEDFTPHSISFSPDGNYVYYAAKETLYQLPILGGLPKKIKENFGLGPITFSPDGKQFAFIRHSAENESAIVITEADGTNERILASSRAPEKFLRSAAWSPDGKIIAATIRDADGGNKIVAARTSDGSISVVPSPIWGLIWEVVWRPDGDGMFVIATEGQSSISAQIWRLSYPGGESGKVSNDFNNYRSISLTRDGGEMVLVREQQAAHIWMLPNGEDASRAKQLTHGLDGYDGIWGVDFLPPGDRIIYGTESRNGGGEVWMIDVPDAGRVGGVKQITDDAGAITVSPDGKYLVFQSRDENNKNAGLFRLNLSDGERKRLTIGADIWATFSPDGRWIVYTRWAEQVALWKVSIDGGEAVKLTDVPGASLAPSVSPDGKLIAFYWLKEKPRQPPEIALVPFGGGEIIKSFEVTRGRFAQNYGKDALQWTPDGQAVNFISHRDGVSNIWRQPTGGGAPAQITNFTSGQIFNFVYSPNGKQFALSRGTYSRDVIIINDTE